MDAIWTILTYPFTLGLLLGLLVAGFLWKSGLAARGHLKREIRRLQEEGRELQGHLNTQLKLNARGTEDIQKELDQIKSQNETLRVNLATLQSKPGRAEQRQHHINEAAIRAMREQAPGFAPAWERALRSAEAEYEDGEKGLKRLVKRVIPAIGTSAAATSVETNHADERDEA